MNSQTFYATTRSKARPLGRMPVAIPHDIDDRSRPVASGVVRLPHHIAWSPPYTYDLDDRRQRCWAYARVMTEGLPEDVLRFVDIDMLIEMWQDIHLPAHVREPWLNWLTEHSYIM